MAVLKAADKRRDSQLTEQPHEDEPRQARDLSAADWKLAAGTTFQNSSGIVLQIRQRVGLILPIHSDTMRTAFSSGTNDAMIGI